MLDIGQPYAKISSLVRKDGRHIGIVATIDSITAVHGKRAILRTLVTFKINDHAVRCERRPWKALDAEHLVHNLSFATKVTHRVKIGSKVSMEYCRISTRGSLTLPSSGSAV